MVPWVGLQCVIVVFPDHTHFRFVTDNDAPLGADTVYTSCLLVKLMVLVLTVSLFSESSV